MLMSNYAGLVGNQFPHADSRHQCQWVSQRKAQDNRLGASCGHQFGLISRSITQLPDEEGYDHNCGRVHNQPAMRAISKGFRQVRAEARQPLKIGIHRDVLAALEVPEKDLARALRIYVSNRVYRDRLRVGATRIDLNGNPAGVVTPDQLVHLRPRAKAAKPPNGTSCEIKTAAAPAEPPALKPSAIASVKRMSLADLRAAAQRRKVANTG